jgi:pimeloyl-ACP methyl ester carboxylesterase
VIRCPLLAVQGVDDEYGTMAQLDGIERHVAHAELLKLAGCGHSPHRDQPQAVIDATAAITRRPVQKSS